MVVVAAGRDEAVTDVSKTMASGSLFLPQVRFFPTGASRETRLLETAVCLTLLVTAVCLTLLETAVSHAA